MFLANGLGDPFGLHTRGNGEFQRHFREPFHKILQTDVYSKGCSTEGYKEWVTLLRLCRESVFLTGIKRVRAKALAARLTGRTPPTS